MMFSLGKFERAIGASLILALTSIRQAYAYIDPGTGSYAIQIAIAFLVGMLFAVKMFGKRMLAFFKKILSSKKENDNGPL